MSPSKDDGQDGIDTDIPSTFAGHLDRFKHTELRGGLSAQSSSRDLQIRSKAADAMTERRSRSTTFKRTKAESSASASPSRVMKKPRSSNKYAAPSKYAHLPPLRDVLESGLICVFIGANPGISTSTSGHAYAHPSNLFWKLLHSSGCTDRRCSPEEDGDLPRLYSLGNTNIVERPTNNTAELSKQEMAAGTAELERKILRYKPEAVCIVGKGIWESVWRFRYGRNPTANEFRYGWQDPKENMGKSIHKNGDKPEDPWHGSKVFVATTTSGLAASLKPAEKEAIWKPFGEWVKQRRLERSLETTVE